MSGTDLDRVCAVDGTGLRVGDFEGFGVKTAPRRFKTEAPVPILLSKGGCGGAPAVVLVVSRSRSTASLKSSIAASPGVAGGKRPSRGPKEKDLIDLEDEGRGNVSDSRREGCGCMGGSMLEGGVVETSN